MIAALQWIWDQLKALFHVVVNLASSIWTWVCAGLAAIADWFLDLVGNALHGIFPAVSWGTAPTDGSALFEKLCYYLALDDAIASLVVVVGVWMAARVARLAMVPIRALLELL